MNLSRHSSQDQENKAATNEVTLYSLEDQKLVARIRAAANRHDKETRVKGLRDQTVIQKFKQASRDYDAAKRTSNPNDYLTVDGFVQNYL